MRTTETTDEPLTSSGCDVESLFRVHHLRLTNFVRVLIQDEEAALDCVQETFLAAHERAGSGGSINGQWLYKVARSRAIDVLRRRKRTISGGEALRWLPASQQYMSDSTRRGLEALATLSPNDRELLYLFLVDRFKTAEIAEMMDVRPGTVRTRLTRARRRLDKAFGGQP